MRTALLLTLSLTVFPSAIAGRLVRAQALKPLLGPQVLCYDAVVRVDGQADSAAEKTAEAQLQAALGDLGLRAQERGTAQRCDHVLAYLFRLDNQSTPRAYNAALTVEHLTTANGRGGDATETLWKVTGWGSSPAALKSVEIPPKWSGLLAEQLRVFRLELQALKGP